jgi:outer membrane lipoprotein-sorting protein
MYSGPMLRTLLTLALAVIVLAPAGPLAAQTPAPAPRAGQPAPSLDDAVKGVESAYGKLNDLKAEFDQTAFNKSLNQSIPAQGIVYLEKGGKLRWE